MKWLIPVCVIVMGLPIGASKTSAAAIEVVPMIGYQFNGSKDLAGPQSDKLDLKDTGLRGLSIGYLNQEGGQLEFAWTRAKSSAEVQLAGGAPSDRFDVRIDRFHLNGLFMFDPAPLQSFILMGVGATHYTPSSNRSSTTLISFALGCGVKWLWTDRIGLRLDGRWTPALTLPGTHFFCDETDANNCYSTQSNSYLSRVLPFMSNFEFTSGLMLRY